MVKFFDPKLSIQEDIPFLHVVLDQIVKLKTSDMSFSIKSFYVIVQSNIQILATRLVFAS